MKVATIEKILEVKPHPNADALELATIKGWQVCIKKGEFNPGDLCIYICVDSILEDLPPYDFLRKKHFRIKTVRLRGELSQGIAFPLSLFRQFNCDVIPLEEGVEGTDISHWVHAKHYEKPVPAQLAGKVVGLMPGFIKKTDEDNIKNNLNVIDELHGKPYYMTIKVDGSSGSYFVKEGVFGACSRNYQLQYEANNSFWKIAEKYQIENQLKRHFSGRNICLQGEVFGPGIQGNPLGVTELSFRAFNLFDIDKQCYLGYSPLVEFCEKSGIPMVEQIETGGFFNKTLKELQEFANGLKYPNGNWAEGIVIRPLDETYSTTLKGRLTGKVISETFELAYS